MGCGQQFPNRPQLFRQVVELMETHLHYIVWGYERIEPGTGNHLDNVILDIFALSAVEALARAKVLVPGKNEYCVRSVIEHLATGACSSHG